MQMLWGGASVLPSEASEAALAPMPLLHYTFPDMQPVPLIPQWPSFCPLDWYRERQVLIAILIFIECLHYVRLIISIGEMPTSLTLGK